ncbi:MAG: hypothetical protein FJ297_01100 [Planctomycetes bacterium]|nr:hypothetical protein [Planctomycetota bacterium]
MDGRCVILANDEQAELDSVWPVQLSFRAGRGPEAGRAGGFGQAGCAAPVGDCARAFPGRLGRICPFKSGLLPTELVTLEQILGSSQGVDDPERVKRFLLDRRRNGEIGYVLLVDDVDVFPVRYMVLDRITPHAFDYAFYPCDLCYSDLARADGQFDDWNGCKESSYAGYFGEVRGEKNNNDPINFDAVDYRPDIAVGRWPVCNEEEVGRVAGKTIAADPE